MRRLPIFIAATAAGVLLVGGVAVAATMPHDDSSGSVRPAIEVPHQERTEAQRIEAERAETERAETEHASTTVAGTLAVGDDTTDDQGATPDATTVPATTDPAAAGSHPHDDLHAGSQDVNDDHGVHPETGDDHGGRGKTTIPGTPTTGEGHNDGDDSGSGAAHGTTPTTVEDHPRATVVTPAPATPTTVDDHGRHGSGRG